MHRRLERHFQQRRSDSFAHHAAQQLRTVVEHSQDIAARQLFGFGGGDEDDDDDDKDEDDSSESTTGTRSGTTTNGSSGGSSDSTDGSGRAGSDSATSSRTTRPSTSFFSFSLSSTTPTRYTSTEAPLTFTESSISTRSITSSSTQPTTISSSTEPSTTASSSSSSRVRPTSSNPPAETTSASLTSVAAVTNSNSLATSTQLITSSAVLASSTASSTGDLKSHSSPGPIIGIVAAALAGAVVIAAIIGFLVKKYSRRADPYESNPFDKDEFRRESVMLPEVFDSDDGHPSMTEYHNYGPGPTSGYDDPYTSAGTKVVGDAVAAYSNGPSSAYTHSETGRPRPPTMFARHNDVHAGGAYSEASRLPAIGAALNTAPSPRLPPIAFGGGDPYSLAGVAGGLHNVSNPYAHLDRNGFMHGYSEQSTGGLHPDGSDGSGDDNGEHLRYRQNDGYETSGRPGTAEGRSGTPDIPNVQQTYALGFDQGHATHPSGCQPAGANSLLDSYSSAHFESGNTPPAPLSNPYDDQYQQHYGSGVSSPKPPATLQVRNLTHSENPSAHLVADGHASGAARSILSAGPAANDDDAYGGVY